MIQESGCSVSVGGRGLRTSSLPFSAIPQQSKLFIEYQQDPLSLKKYYPSVVASHTEAAARVPEVLSNYTTDRTRLCDTLALMNGGFGAGTRTLEHIDLLREADAVAVVTGQQTSLFTGPLYSIYKALSAIKMSECLRGRGIKAVPVFWMATEDHDVEEVSNAFVIDAAQGLAELRVTIAEDEQGWPVGGIELLEFVPLRPKVHQVLASLVELEDVVARVAV